MFRLNSFQESVSLLFVLLELSIIACCAGCYNQVDENLARQAVIIGGSMAPNLMGDHFEFICADCKFQFAADAEKTPLSKTAVCPNCGFSDNQYEDAIWKAASDVQLITEEVSFP